VKDYRSLIEKKTHINRDSRKYNKIEHAPVLPNNGLKFLLILPSHPVVTNGIGILEETSKNSKESGFSSQNSEFIRILRADGFGLLLLIAYKFFTRFARSK
jgi:hypothetical protein